jgi:hypothetical protein
MFQHELAQQLTLLDVQVYVNYFEFGDNSRFSLKAVANGPLNAESDIGPTSGFSFALADITRINQTLWNHTLKFNSTYFSTYSVISVTPHRDRKSQSTMNEIDTEVSRIKYLQLLGQWYH